MPSSPMGPCSRGSTTVAGDAAPTSVVARPLSNGSGSTSGPSTASASGRGSIAKAASPASRAGPARSATTQLPSRVMPTGTTSKRSWSRAATTWRAVSGRRRAPPTVRRRAPPVGSSPPTGVEGTGGPWTAKLPPPRRRRWPVGGRYGGVVEFTAAEIASAVGGILHGDDVVVDGASIDSRTIDPGQLFVPAVGVRDGHTSSRRPSTPEPLRC